MPPPPAWIKLSDNFAYIQQVLVKIIGKFHSQRYIKCILIKSFIRIWDQHSCLHNEIVLCIELSFSKKPSAWKVSFNYKQAVNKFHIWLHNLPTEIQTCRCKRFCPLFAKVSMTVRWNIFGAIYQHLQMLISLELDNISRNISGVLTSFSCTFMEENKDFHFIYTL